MSENESYEIRFWPVGDDKDHERWISFSEPEYLPNGAIRFTCTNGLEHYINGSIEVIK